MTWATADDVTGAWIGAGVPTDDDLVDKWIGKAEREIRRHVPDVQDRIDSGDEPDLKDDVVDVVVAMVTRVFRNPEGVRQTQETTGPFTSSTTYGGDLPGGLVLTNDELAKLQGRAEGAFEIDLLSGWSPRGWSP